MNHCSFGRTTLYIDIDCFFDAFIHSYMWLVIQTKAQHMTADLEQDIVMTRILFHRVETEIKMLCLSSNGNFHCHAQFFHKYIDL